MPKLFDKFLNRKDIVSPKARIQPMLSLSISAGVVKASVWELQDNNVEILGLGVKTYSENGIEKQVDYKGLLEKSADAIDAACQVAETDVRKTVFGLPQVWIENEQLLPEYDAMMEKLAKTLDLESVAYVSIPHAISYYLQYLHRTPPTAILIGSSREGAFLSYVENGKIKESRYVSWSGGSLGKNIDKGLLQFQSLKSFPSSFYLYGYGDLVAARNDLNKYSWSSNDRLGEGKPVPQFIASPKITVLEEHVDALSVSLVGAKDYARQNGIQGKLHIKSLEYRDLNTESLVVENEASLMPAVIPEIQSADTGQQLDDHQKSIHDEVPFGFVLNQDVQAHSPDNNNVDNNSEVHSTDDSIESEAITENDSLQEELYTEIESDHKENQEQSQEIHPQFDKPWQSQQNGTRGLLSSLKKPKLSGRNTKQLLIISSISIVFLLLISAGTAWAYWNIPKATVTIYVKTQSFGKPVTLTASENAVLSTENSTLPLTKITAEVTENKTSDTTGKRQIGQVSKGTVTIYNKTGSEKTFTSGSQIIGPNNLKFTLSENVSVASSSAEATDEGETKTYGKANVNVTAIEIGPEGNLSKDTSFSIPPFTKDDYEAKAASDFSGGSKKDIRVVSSADRNNLSKEVKSILQGKVLTTLREKVTSDQVLMDDAWSIVKTTEKFDKNINDESDTVTLQTTATAQGYLVNKSDIENILSNSVSASIPSGFDLKDKNTGINTKFLSLDKDGKLTFEAAVSATIIPKLNEDQISKSIIGKNEQAAIDTIKTDDNVFDVTIDYSMTLPGFLQTLPHQQKNITIKRSVR